jgi:hypothetical protein
LKEIIAILYKRPFFLLLLFLVIAYLPVFLPFFHLKNDLISQNLPTRYIISESLYSGYFPWWNPYIHFGIPQYGDMNTGFWNPFLWLIAKTSGYNIWTITYEEMFYILLGGWGIYKVVKELGISKEIAIVTALSYMSCGYITGHVQYFCWITGTAFFPYVLLYFLKINKFPVFKNYIIGALTVFLFISSTHPGLIIGAAYFFLFALIILFLFRRSYARGLYRPEFWLINFIFLLISILFCFGVLISDIDVLQDISRGSKISLQQSLLAPATFQSYLSVLFPLAVNKSSFFATDISMRNVFVGIAGLSGFIFLFRYVSKNFLVALLSVLLFFILLSAGSIFKTVFYYTLPFLGYVRLNGEFAYFVLLILLLAGAVGLHHFLSDSGSRDLLKRLMRFFMIAASAAIVIALLAMIFSRSSVIYSLPPNGKDFRSIVKDILDRFEFADLLLVSAFIQLIAFLLISRNFSSPKRMAVIAIINLVINTWLSLPFTGLGMASKKQIHEEMFVPPHGLFAQELTPLSKTVFLDSSLKEKFTLVGTYSKKIGYPQEEQYPVELNSTEQFYKDSALQRFIYDQSYIFLSTDTTITAKTNFDSSRIEIVEFGAGYLRLIIDNPGYHFITFLQNNYPYWQTFINGKITRHYTGFKTFISVPVERGRQEVVFKFNPSPIKKAIAINIVILLIGLFSLLHPRLRNKLVVS